MILTPEESYRNARALLATVKKLLTGREIAICQKVVADPGCLTPPWPHEGEDLDDILAKMTVYKNAEADRSAFYSLTVQFSREVGQWLNRVRIKFPASGDASGSPAVAKCVPVGDPPTLAGVYGSPDSGGVSGEWEDPPFPVQMGATYREKSTGNLVVGLVEVDSRINLIAIEGRRMTSQEFGSEFELVSMYGEEVAS